MNITLSADEEIVDTVRTYARRNGTSLNQIIRDHLVTLVMPDEKKKTSLLAEEFRSLTTQQAGKSPRGWTFDRNSIQRHP